MSTSSAPHPWGKNDVRQTLHQHIAEPALEKLIAAGCDRLRLVSSLQILFNGFGDESWGTLIASAWPDFHGNSQKKLKRGIEQIRQCASDIERLNRTFFSAVCFPFGSEHQPRFSDLPGTMRKYADAWEIASAHFGPKKRPLRAVSKALIVAYVTGATGSPHDEEVSALIAAATKTPYTTDAHRQWRSENAELIERTAPLTHH